MSKSNLSNDSLYRALLQNNLSAQISYENGSYKIIFSAGSTKHTTVIERKRLIEYSTDESHAERLVASRTVDSLRVLELSKQLLFLAREYEESRGKPHCSFAWKTLCVITTLTTM